MGVEVVVSEDTRGVIDFREEAEVSSFRIVMPNGMPKTVTRGSPEFRRFYDGASRTGETGTGERISRVYCNGSGSFYIPWAAYFELGKPLKIRKGPGYAPAQ